MQPSERATLDQIALCLKPNLAQNDVICGLRVMLLATKSAKIAKAIEEITRLGLAGPDWEARLHHLEEHIPLAPIHMVGMAVLLRAKGCSQREIGDRVAAHFGVDSLSFSAASKAVRRALFGSKKIVSFMMPDTPLATFRKQLKLARAKLGFADHQKLMDTQEFEVLKTVIKANGEAKKREISGRDSE
jgi:hypothetical protein